MKKRMLLTFPVLGLTERMKKVQEGQPGVQEASSEKNYGFLRTAIKDEILYLEVYLQKQAVQENAAPHYRVFFDKDKRDFITYTPAIQQWSGARLDNLLGICDFYIEDMMIEQKEKECLLHYLEIDSIQRLYRWQQVCRETTRMEGYERRARKWDAVFEKIHSVPKDWERWLLRHVIDDHYVLYEYRENGITTGICSRCGKIQTLDHPKYNGSGTCKKCGAIISYKSVGKCPRIVTESYDAHLLQKMENKVVSRQFRGFAVFDPKKWEKPRLHFWEERRILIERDGTMKAYSYEEYKDKKMHWIPARLSGTGTEYYYHNPYHYSAQGRVYRRTLPALEAGPLKHTGIRIAAETGMEFAPEAYLTAVQRYPILEKIRKAGLLSLYQEYLINWAVLSLEDKGELHKSLGIRRDQLKQLRIQNGGSAYLEWLQFEHAQGKDLAEEIRSWFMKNKIQPEHLSFIQDRMSLIQVKHYLCRQKNLMAGKSYKEILSVWKDYLQMAKVCGMNTKDAIIYRTGNLEKRHNDLVLLIEEKKNKQDAQEILKRFPELNDVLKTLKEKYEYRDDTYAVIAPDDVTDIIQEGNTLHHCINKTDTYFERIVKKESFLLFLRKTNDLETPYYTLEVEPGGTIRQKRTEYDRQNKDLEKASIFLKQWQHVIRKRLEQTDHVLAGKSRLLRMQEIKKLREDQLAIHQDIYHGELLADILEADLMEIEEAA